jgi:hypothetical protein
MKLAFYEPHLCLRGTTVAVFDYAYYIREYYNIQPLIINEINHPVNNSSVIRRFKKEFECISINNFSELDRVLTQEKADYVYTIKQGFKSDGKIVNNTKMLIHATGTPGPTEKHGHKYAYVSKWSSQYCSNLEIPYVPHMINLPEEDGNIRTELGIPKDAIVFGRTGGVDSWDISFVNNAIYDSLNTRKDIYFIFQNTNLPFKHERIKHIMPSQDPIYKVKFINSCDAFLHARSQGESFGIACGEFSSKNKPIITWTGSRERSHIDILGDKGVYYNNKQDVYNILCNFEKQEKDWNCYREFNPEEVIKKFKEVFLNE